MTGLFYCGHGVSQSMRINLMEEQAEKDNKLQEWADSLSKEQVKLMLAILQSQMFTLNQHDQ